MIDKQYIEIFKNGSKTFYNSSRFFPKKYKKDVYVLYAFVRNFDNYVDATPQEKDKFYSERDRFWETYKSNNLEEDLTSEFVELCYRKNFKEEWLIVFFKSMESDLNHTRCETLQDAIDYMYGSAEVIGLMMSAVLDLPEESHRYASELGKAYQYINFIRDIAEDIKLGRQYIPQSELEKYGFKEFKSEDFRSKPKQFKALMKAQVGYYKKWLEIGKKGYKFLPKRILIPVKTATDMYNWTGETISKNPQIVFTTKVKPSRLKIFLYLIKNSIL